jgi:hypothetical protein
MNKKRIIEELEQFQFDKHEYCILSSGALVVYGILEEAGDLDLALNESGLEKIKKVYPDIYQREDGWYTVTEECEVVIGVVKKGFYHGYPLQDLQELLDFYKDRDFEKDKVKVEKINKFLKSINQ